MISDRQLLKDVSTPIYALASLKRPDRRQLSKRLFSFIQSFRSEYPPLASSAATALSSYGLHLQTGRQLLARARHRKLSAGHQGLVLPGVIMVHGRLQDRAVYYTALRRTKVRLSYDRRIRRSRAYGLPKSISASVWQANLPTKYDVVRYFASLIRRLKAYRNSDGNRLASSGLAVLSSRLAYLESAGQIKERDA